jgi:spore maturation protein CgeB
MRVLIVDPYYPEFLRSVYAAHQELAPKPYDRQWRALMDTCFGVADFYSTNLVELGHDAVEVVPNCMPMQHKWAEENAGSAKSDFAPPGFVARLIQRARRGATAKWLSRVLIAQAERFRPDVIHVHDPNGTSPALLRELRPHTRLVVAQLGSQLDPRTDFSMYDLVLSSFPHYVERLRATGTRAEYFRLGFEPSILPRLTGGAQRDAVFIGGLSPVHDDRRSFLEALTSFHDFEWWGYGVELLPPGSPLRNLYRGPAWGLQMYCILRSARIAINQHGNLAGIGGCYANNMRLFEATGVGAMLLTDSKRNLGELFRVEKEVVEYSSVQECAERITYFLCHDDERAAVASAGQQRTLAEHTYRHRMEEYIELLLPLL